MNFLKRVWAKFFGPKVRCHGRGSVMGNRLSGGRNIGAGV